MAIKNAKLKELVLKVPNYRGPNKINLKATEAMILSPLILMSNSGLEENRYTSNSSVTGNAQSENWLWIVFQV